MTIELAIMAVAQTLLAIAAAPLLIGWMDQCRAWLQNKSGPGLLQPYRTLRKLFHKDAHVASHASFIFRLSPYVQFGAMALAAAIIPIFTRQPLLATSADTIALVSLFAVTRVFIALAGMDIGTAFGTLGARREMLVGFLSEPALLMVLFTASLLSQSTLLPVIVDSLAQRDLGIYPSLAFSAVAFMMVLLSENARIPIDNPATHLELTMIHEAMVLEYSARHLALIEWASALKLFNFAAIGIALFIPWGLPLPSDGAVAVLSGCLLTLLKLGVIGAAIVLIESVSAKLRLFRAPEFLATAFLLSVLGLLVHQLLETQP